MTKLILIRHGETEKNISRELYTADDLETLNEKGKTQMRATALVLKKMSPSVIYSSTEKRAQESAEILSRELNVPLKTIDGMQERNWGDFSGKLWSEVETILNQMSLEERYNYVPPNGESWKEAEERLIKAVNIVLKENEGKAVIIISHGGAIRILMPYLLNLPKEESFKHDPANASISIFNYIDGKFIKRIIDDTSHLKT